ncbi:hypothetical protein LSUB1_G004946 [Lachnellula subtilissima]|uniref:Uncharacterized protein n=1 Tax=Lachnellula subtilissima TaxID=602034 RepID=A0A8H8RNH9_9HELO|nr:hypothetical protein LSUB1_G004946 [Lachnellula subtilissima]
MSLATTTIVKPLDIISYILNYPVKNKDSGKPLPTVPSPMAKAMLRSSWVAKRTALSGKRNMAHCTVFGLAELRALAPIPY